MYFNGAANDSFGQRFDIGNRGTHSLDIVFISKGWDVYLRVHEIGIHSLAGSLAVAAGAAFLVFVVQRNARYLSLMLAAAIGTLSHLVFDLISGATIRAGWPLFDNQLSIPLVAMADPWLAGIGVGGALMAAAVPHWTAARGSEVIHSRVVEAEWAALTEWNVFDRTPLALRKWRVSAFGSAPTLMFTRPLQPEMPMVAASRSLDTVQNFCACTNSGSRSLRRSMTA